MKELCFLLSVVHPAPFSRDPLLLSHWRATSHLDLKWNSGAVVPFTNPIDEELYTVEKGPLFILTLSWDK